MHNDVAVRIGKGHLFCEDFGRYNRTGGTPYVILSDGCSDPNSPDTNIGAILLSIAAETYFSQSHPCIAKPEGEELHTQILFLANMYVASMQLDPHCLDATLLTASLYPNNDGARHILATAFGDGVFAARKRNGEINVFDIHYDSGIPYYMNYENDPKRKKSMLDQTNGNPHLLSNHVIKPDGEVVDLKGFDEICNHPLVTRYFPVEEYDFVAIMSDGVHNIGRIEANGTTTYLPFIEAVKRLMGFGAALAGEFVQRRMRVFEQYCHQNGFEFLDDLSIGVIHIEH